MFQIFDGKLKIDDNGKMWSQCGCGNDFAKKVIEIGNWNMNINLEHSFSHGLTLSKIIAVYGVVVNDLETIKYPIMGHDGGTIPLQIDYVDSTKIYLKLKMVLFLILLILVVLL